MDSCLYSRHLSAGHCIDIVRRSCILIVLGVKGLYLEVILIMMTSGRVIQLGRMNPKSNLRKVHYLLPPTSVWSVSPKCFHNYIFTSLSSISAMCTEDFQHVIYRTLLHHNHVFLGSVCARDIRELKQRRRRRLENVD